MSTGIFGVFFFRQITPHHVDYVPGLRGMIGNDSPRGGGGGVLPFRYVPRRVSFSSIFSLK